MEHRLFTNELCEQSIKKISEGDLGALTVLYDCVGRLIFSIAFSVLGDYQLSEDAMQDTFLQIADKAGTYRKGGSAKAWIASICRNIALNTLKKRQRELPAEENTNQAVDAFSEEKLIMSVTLSDALALLTAEEREIVVYKTMWKLKHKHIAQLMGLSAANSRQKHKRALEKLRAYYFDEGGKVHVCQQKNTKQI